MNISETDNALDFDLALSVALYFRVKQTRGKEILSIIRNVVSDWRSFADKYHISRIEQGQMEIAFEHGS